jgi:hypothetical protein
MKKIRNMLNPCSWQGFTAYIESNMARWRNLARTIDHKDKDASATTMYFFCTSARVRLLH